MKERVYKQKKHLEQKDLAQEDSATVSLLLSLLSRLF